jgi:hypothetical protein
VELLTATTVRPRTTRRAWSGAILGLIAAAALFAAPAAEAACGGVEHYRPLKHRRSPAPLAIGDSVMLGAVTPLRRSGFEVDARGCRSMGEGLQLLLRRRRSKSLPSVVVVALGNNFPLALSEIARARRILGPNRVLGMVTPRESASSRRAIRAAARRWPVRVRVLRWAARSAGRSWTWDGLHLTPAGARGFARLLRHAYKWPLPAEVRDRPGGGRSGGGGLLLAVATAFALLFGLVWVGGRRPPTRRHGRSYRPNRPVSVPRARAESASASRTSSGEASRPRPRGRRTAYRANR